MNCSFNIRYKPRTTRAFTKSDLTVYDSAGNTALNALTVYGKSEVVDGAIVSAGEGWATVDLGTLNWTKGNRNNTDTGYIYYAYISDAVRELKNYLVTKFKKTVKMSWEDLENSQCMLTSSPYFIVSYDANSLSDFLQAVNGVILAYQLADPTQGNCIAVKTDDGTGINGTMAVFTTGTPLRGIPDSDVRDVMAWDGSSGEVTKVCAKVRLADLTWQYNDTKQRFHATLSNANLPILATAKANLLSSNYATKTWADFDESVFDKFIAGIQTFVGIRDTNYTTVSDFVASLGDAELVYELATPTTEQLTTAENASIAGLRTFEPQTHAQNNAQTDMTVDYTIRVPTI